MNAATRNPCASSQAVAWATMLAILCCGGTIGCGASRASLRNAQPIVASVPELRLAELTPVIGTHFFRARLVKDSDSGKGKSLYRADGSTHNLLFVDSRAGTAQWLLPDNDHEIVRMSDLPEQEEDSAPTRVTVALVKARSEDLSVATGRLLLISPAGDRVVEVASEVREINAATLIEDQTLSLVYERHRKLVVAQLDLQHFAMLHQKEIAVPLLQ